MYNNAQFKIISFSVNISGDRGCTSTSVMDIEKSMV